MNVAPERDEGVSPSRMASTAGLVLKPVSVIEAVANSLRERVVSGELGPGSQLREIKLASEYRVARPTVRAALQQLTLSGLLRRETHRSAIVPSLRAEDVSDLFAARKLVELEVARLLTERRIRPKRAELAVRRLERFGDDARWSEVVEADLEVHRALTEAAGSPRLMRLFDVLEDEIRLAIAQLRPAYGSPADLAREHRELLTAIESGRAEVAIGLMRRHLDEANDDLMSTS